MLEDVRLSSSEPSESARIAWTGSQLGVLWVSSLDTDPSSRMAVVDPDGTLAVSASRDETVKVLQSVNVNPMDLERDVVRGQYGPGTLEGRQLSGYREEEAVAAMLDRAAQAVRAWVVDGVGPARFACERMCAYTLDPDFP